MTQIIETSAPARAGSVDIFKPMTMLIILMIGIISFGAFIALSGFEGDLQSKDNGRSHALSTSPNGYAALIKLMDSQEGMTVKLEREPSSRWLEPDALRIYTAPRPRMSEKIEALSSTAPSLYVIPKRIVTRSTEFRGRFERSGLWQEQSIKNDYAFLDESLQITRSDDPVTSQPVLMNSEDVQIWESLIINDLQSITGDDILPVIRIDGKTVLGRITDTNNYILSDPDLLENSAMKELSRARFALEMLDVISQQSEGDYQYYFDLTLHGMGGNQNFVKLMLQPPFLAATLCMLLTGLLLAWRAFTRFGAPYKPVRAYALGKQALANNSADLIRLAGREPNMAPGYAALIRKLTARIVRVPKTLSAADTITTLDKIGKRSGATDSLGELSAHAETITNNTQLMQLAKQLYNWREEITDEPN